MAEAIAGPLLGKLQELALNEAKALVKVKDDIRRLQDRLVWLQAFLMEADPIRRVDGNMLTGVLVSQTRAVALDSEDAIDRYLKLYDNIPSRRDWRRVTNVPKHMERFAKQFLVRHCLSRELTILNERIEQILQSREKYKLGDLIRTGSESPVLMLTSGWSLLTTVNVSPYRNTQTERCEDMFLELEDDIGELRRHLTRPKGFVVFISGDTSGVGKTSLMRRACEDDGIVKHFPIRIWIDLPPRTSSDTFNSRIEECLGVRNSGTDDHSMISHRLVVIDCNDVSYTSQSVEKWWPDARVHDKIVLITNRVPPALIRERFKDKYGDDRCNFLMKLGHLQKEDVWKLLYYKLSGVDAKKIEKRSTNPEFEEALSSILREVTGDDGLASAVVVMLAHLLRSSEKSSWGSLFQQISKSTKETRLQMILLLSFNVLPNDLKPCFLYFAGFLPETKICTRELVRLWVAEGFLSSKDGKSMEIVGHGYLMELITRDLVQVVTREESGFVKFVAITGYVHSFLSVEARESSFLDVHFLNHAPDAATVRRLSIPDNQSDPSAFSHKYPKLRSLISMEKGTPRGWKDHVPLPYHSPSSINENRNDGTGTAANDPSTQQPKGDPKILKVLAGSRYLRVISLQGHNVGTKMPICVSNNVHLRYLRVKSKNITKIPKSIGDLQRLQTLDVRGTNVSWLPDEFWKIKTLRHVLGDCLRLPGPALDSNVRNLQTLETVSLIDSDDKIMTNMPNLVSLAIEGLHGSRDIFVALSELINLSRLSLAGDNINVASMGRGNRNLEILELTGNLQIPNNNDVSFMKSSFFSLSVLKLKDTSVTQDFVNGIGHLPKLTHLLLQENSCDLIYLEIPKDSFKSLSVLELMVSESDKLNEITVNLKLIETFTFQLIACREVTIKGNNEAFQQLKPSYSGERFTYSIGKLQCPKF